MKLSTYTCVICGRTFEASQRSKYCSPSCKSYVANHKTVVTQCIVCNRMFTALASSKAKFCSQQCHADAIRDVTNNPNSKFADIVKPRKPTEVVERYCIDCGKKFETKGHSYVNRRCPDCMREYKRLWGLDAKGLKRELEKGTYKQSDLLPMVDTVLEANGIKIDVTDTAQIAKSEAQSFVEPTQTREEHNAKRRALRARKKALGILAEEEHDRTGYRKITFDAKGTICSCCGYDLYVDALHVHHLDLNRENNNQGNLVVLCANCHSILHKRIKRNFSLWEDKPAGCVKEYHSLLAEVKERNEAGKPDRATRTEGSEESGSGATHSSTSRPDMNCHEAAPLVDDLGFDF